MREDATNAIKQITSIPTCCPILSCMQLISFFFHSNSFHQFCSLLQIIVMNLNAPSRNQKTKSHLFYFIVSLSIKFLDKSCLLFILSIQGVFLQEVSLLFEKAISLWFCNEIDNSNGQLRETLNRQRPNSFFVIQEFQDCF